MKWTEQQIEEWLEPQTRTIIDRAGNEIHLEQTTIFWRQYDRLIAQGYQEPDLIGCARDGEIHFGFPLAISIQNVVGHLTKIGRGQ